MKILASFSALMALVATPAMAQDSVSQTLIATGDAIPAYDTNEQINDYVVDSNPFVSSWGNTYAEAPLVKASMRRIRNCFFMVSMFNSLFLC